MILADTSAWIEYLRRTGSEADRRLQGLIESDAQPATTAVVLMEVLAGARDGRHAERLRRLVLSGEFLPIDLDDYESAAALYRECRRAGDSPRHLIDCLIAAVAIRSDAELLHADRDFTVIARHSTLRLVSGTK